jgi:hypothetical protein
MATRIRKQWLDLTYSPTGLTADDIKHSDITTVKSAIDSLYSKIAYRTLTVTKSGTGTGTVTSDPSGIDCGSTCSYQFTFGTNVTLTATPDSGSAFGGWSGDVTGSGSGSTITITMDSNKSVISTFNLSYTLTVTKSGVGIGTITSNPAGIDCGPTCSYQFASGTNVILIATPDSGSVFGGWSGDVIGSCSTIIVTMDSNKSVTSTFNALYTLTVTKSGIGAGTVTSSPAGIDCGPTCSYQFVSGTNITLTATPDSGSAFGGWSGDATDTNSIVTITMNSDKSVTAIFNVNNEDGYFVGGYTSDSSGYNYSFIDKLLFNNETRSTLSATLSQSVNNQSACNSTLAGFFAGGYGSRYQSFIDKLLFNGESRSTLSVTLSQSIYMQSACNSTLAGFFAGGTNNNGSHSFIDKLLFNGESRSTLTTTLSQSIYSQSACNSTLSGYFAGGTSGEGVIYYSYIDKLLFSDDSRSTLAATLSQSIYYQSACNSTSAGYFAGGMNDNYQSYIDKLLFSDKTRSTLSATLSQTVYAQSACNSTSAGYFAGGINYDIESSYFQSFIDKLLFSNDSRSTLAATLSQSISEQSACQSGGIL